MPDEWEGQGVHITLNDYNKTGEGGFGYANTQLSQDDVHVSLVSITKVLIYLYTAETFTFIGSAGTVAEEIRLNYREFKDINYEQEMIMFALQLTLKEITLTLSIGLMMIVFDINNSGSV